MKKLTGLVVLALTLFTIGCSSEDSPTNSFEPDSPSTSNGTTNSGGSIGNQYAWLQEGIWAGQNMQVRYSFPISYKIKFNPNGTYEAVRQTLRPLLTPKSDQGIYRISGNVININSHTYNEQTVYTFEREGSSTLFVTIYGEVYRLTKE